jgi:pilus assembly protein CpaE
VSLLAVTGAKGGCGASLVATNLALALTRHGSTLLVDLHAGDGNDDLLLDLRAERSWADLLPVAGELGPRHVELATRPHATGLRFLAGPDSQASYSQDPRLTPLLTALSAGFEWVVVDTSKLEWTEAMSPLVDMLAIVLTGDPPALRAAQRLLAGLPAEARPKARLILNQHSRAHPATPAALASSLECPLLGVVPSDARAVGFQVNFGRPCVLDPRSGFGRAAAAMANGLAARRGARKAAA